MFQHFAADRTGVFPRADSASEVQRLVNLYPNLSEVETARLINLYRELPPLEMALIISDERLGPKLDRFVADHRSKVRPNLRQYAGFLAILAIGAAVALWAIIAA